MKNILFFIFGPTSEPAQQPLFPLSCARPTPALTRAAQHPGPSPHVYARPHEPSAPSLRRGTRSSARTAHARRSLPFPSRCDLAPSVSRACLLPFLLPRCFFPFLLPSMAQPRMASRRSSVHARKAANHRIPARLSFFRAPSLL